MSPHLQGVTLLIVGFTSVPKGYQTVKVGHWEPQALSVGKREHAQEKQMPTESTGPGGEGPSWLPHNGRAKTVVMSAQGSFPQFLKKTPGSPPRASGPRALRSHLGFLKVAAYPSASPRRGAQRREPTSPPEASSLVPLCPHGPLVAWSHRNTKGRGNSGSRAGSFSGWTCGSSNTGACCHRNVSPSRRVWEGSSGPRAGRQLRGRQGWDARS